MIIEKIHRHGNAATLIYKLKLTTEQPLLRRIHANACFALSFTRNNSYSFSTSLATQHGYLSTFVVIVETSKTKASFHFSPNSALNPKKPQKEMNHAISGGARISVKPGQILEAQIHV